MKTVFCAALFVFGLVGPSYGQSVPVVTTHKEISGGKAFALSLLLPGLGHRYVHGGNWDGWASVFSLTDAALWAGLAGAEWSHESVVESYQTLASTRAGADVEGKGRDFYLSLASYMSAEEYLQAQLRNRNWSQIGFAEDPSNFWAWESESDFERFRSLRGDAESLKRRRTFIIASLVANRLISGFTALRSARRHTSASFALGVPPAGARTPLLRVTLMY